MPSVAEVLRQSGFSDEQIKGLDTKVITTFDGILSTATVAQERAELEHRSNRQFYEESIAPALNNWGTEKGNLEAELAFYRAQNEAARVNGFVPAEAPSFQGRDGGGRYVPNAPGSTPGSPTFDVQQVYQRAGDAVGILTDIQWEHQRLFGAPMPISPTELIRQADAVKLDPKTYASRTFNWDTRRQELATKKQEEHDAAIVAKATAENDRRWAEKLGNNPDIRVPQSSRYADVQRAVKAGERPDPLQLGEVERRRATQSAIRADLAGSDAA